MLGIFIRILRSVQDVYAYSIMYTECKEEVLSSPLIIPKVSSSSYVFSSLGSLYYVRLLEDVFRTRKKYIERRLFIEKH